MNIIFSKKILLALLSISSLLLFTSVNAAENMAPIFTKESIDSKKTTIPHKKATINAKFSNIEIGKLLRLITKVGNKSIVIASGISQKISINFENTPYDIALTSVLIVGKLEMTEINNVIIVQTSEDSHITKDFQVKNIDVANIEKTIITLFGEQAKIQVDQNTNIILITASRKTLRSAEKVIHKLDVPQKQVMIEAAFVEISLDDTISTGVNLAAILNKFDSSFSVLSGGFASRGSLENNSVGLFSNSEVYVGKSNRSITAMIEALQTETDLKVLTHPKVITLNDQEAELIVGKKLGFRITTTTATGSLESVEFLKVGTLLRFKPHITENNDIIMTIHPEVSDGSISENGLPSETTTEITTKVRVHDGQTIVLGGLIRERNEKVIQKVPLLGDIPFLGALFRRTVDSVSRSEILVFITPRIIKDSMTSPVTRQDVKRFKNISRNSIINVVKKTKRLSSSPTTLTPDDDQLWLWDDDL